MAPRCRNRGKEVTTDEVMKDSNEGDVSVLISADGQR